MPDRIGPGARTKDPTTDALAFCRERDGWFYFRSGNGAYEDVKISSDDLERAFAALGLLPQAAEGTRE